MIMVWGGVGFSSIKTESPFSDKVNLHHKYRRDYKIIDFGFYA